MIHPDAQAARDLPIFRIADRVVGAREVRAAADVRGTLDAARRDFLSGLAAERSAARSAGVVDESDVERRMDEFRYERRLLTAEETEAWLDARGLTQDDLEAFARRESLRARAGEAESDVGPTSIPAPSEAAFSAHILLSGDLSREARHLARRMAALEEVGSLAGAGGPSEEREHFLALEASYRRRSAALLTDAERERRRTSRRLELTRADLELLDVPTLDAARESILCLRDDGGSLAALAAENGYRYVRAEVFLEDLADELRARVVSAAAGDVLEPIESEARIRVCRVLSKRPPESSDPDVRERIDREILDAHDAELVAGRVRWLLEVDEVE